MSTSNNIQHSNLLLADLKRHINELESEVAQLQEEIRLMKEFHDRLDDL